MSKKIRPRNFPTFLLEGLYAVAQAGEEKYGTYDFLDRDYTVNDHLDALKRHLMRYEDPNQSDLDEDSNRVHLFHCAWRAIMAAYTHENRPQLDDRYKVKRDFIQEAAEEIVKIQDDILKSQEKLSETDWGVVAEAAKGNDVMAGMAQEMINEIISEPKLKPNSTWDSIKKIEVPFKEINNKINEDMAKLGLPEVPKELQKIAEDNFQEMAEKIYMANMAGVKVGESNEQD